MKIRLVSLFLLAGFLVLIFLEVTLRFETSIKELRISGKYDEIAGFGVDSDCNPFERLYPHPHFAYIVTKDDRCEVIEKNDIKVETGDSYTILLLGSDLALDVAKTLEAELNKSFRSPTGQPFRVLTEAAPGWKQPIQTFVFSQKARTVNAVISIEGQREVQTILEGRKLDAPPELYYFVTRSKDYDGVSHRPLLSLKRIIDTSTLLKNSAIALRFYLWKKHKFEAQFARESNSSLLYRSFSYPESWTSDFRIQTGVTRYVDLIEAMGEISDLWALKSALFFEAQSSSAGADTVFEKLKEELRFRKPKLSWMTLSPLGNTEVTAASLVEKLAKSWGLKEK